MTASRTARLLIVAVCAAVLGTLGLASPADASVTGSRHALGCAQGRVLANVGTVTTDREEEVYWAPVLYVWTATGWAAVNDVPFAGWAKAGAVGGRTGTWWDATTNNTVQFRPYNVRPGYYAIVNYIWTPSGGYTMTVSYTTAGSYFCQL
jgi:hypothetical protein